MNERYYFIDYLKAFAIISVIFTHSYFANTIRENFIISYFVNMAVPIFMLITGFNYANSYLKKGISDILQMYNFKLLAKKIFRLALPFTVILIIEYLCHFKDLAKYNFIGNFFTGGIGRGNYYFPVMLQIIAIFPLLYLGLQKIGKNFIYFILIISVAFEIFCAGICMKNGFYRLISIRYFLYVCLGAWLAISPKISNNKLLVSFFIGLNAITLFMYNSDAITYPFTHWKHTNIIFAFYIFPIFAYIFYNYSSFKFDNIFGKILSVIGKASWHIFLVQMFLYGALNEWNCFEKFQTSTDSIITVLLCIFVGIIFYFAEDFLRKITKQLCLKSCK